MEELTPQSKLLAHSGEGNISPEEGYLLSRVQSVSSLEELISLCPWPKERTRSLVEGLLQKNYLILSDQATTQKSEKVSTENLSDLSEDFLNQLFVQLERFQPNNPYATLNLKPYSKAEDVKKQYHTLSKLFHPDRFFGQNLGPYKETLQKAFTQIQHAYESLKNPHEKEALDRTLKHEENSPAPKETPAPKNLSKEMQTMGKAETFFHQGQELEKTGDYLGAYNQYLLASQLDPKREVYKTQLEKIKPNADRGKSLEILKRAEKIIASEPTEEAYQLVREARKLDPESIAAKFALAQCIIGLEKEKEYNDAYQFLVRVKAARPQSGDPCVELGRCHEARGNKIEALHEYEEALVRDPNHKMAKYLLNKLEGKK